MAADGGPFEGARGGTDGEEQRTGRGGKQTHFCLKSAVTCGKACLLNEYSSHLQLLSFSTIFGLMSSEKV